MYQPGDTLCAIASATSGARGIVRVSGPQAVALVAGIFDNADDLLAAGAPLVVAGSLQLAKLPPLPAELYVSPDARSYTREPLVEIHTFGSAPLLAAIQRELMAAGARPAQPGEFTLRAFLAGRLDLTQAEAVLGVIHARGERELKTALAQLAGGLARPMTALRDDLLDLLAELEAGLDFVEEDLQFISQAELARRLRTASEEVARLAEQMRSRGEFAELPRVVLRGAPNVGKSSLFNRLADDAQALVADVAGTTRDYITGRLTLDGLVCQLIDTAGLDDRGASDLDRLAQSAAVAQHEAATLELLCVEASSDVSELDAASPDRLLVVTKCDDGAPDTEFPNEAILTSSRTGQGIDLLRAAIAARLSRRAAETAVVPATAERCRASLARAAESLARATQLASSAGQEELIAAEVRVALGELGQVVGAVYTDDLLDRIFSRFCIGK